MMHQFDQLYINGAWTPNQSLETTSVFNPSTEVLCGLVPTGNAQDVEEAVSAARHAFPSWSNTSAAVRSNYLLAITEQLHARQDEIAKIISEEQGSPLSFAKDVQAGLGTLVMNSYIDKAAEMDRVRILENSIESEAYTHVVKQAVGVCAFITPWNYPLHQLVTKVAPAIAAGCTMVVKPSQEAPLNAFILAEILHEVGLPKGVFNLVSGPGRVVGEALCAHPDVDMVSFTGSTGAGQRISELASKTVKRVCLELGGKSPNIVLDDADLPAAIQSNIYQTMANSGQTCAALTRLLVPVSRYEEAKALIKTEVAAIKVGRPDEPDVRMGPMVSAAQKQTVQRYIQLALEEGASLLCGGLGSPSDLDKGYFVHPTVFVDVDNSMRVAQEEVFGPLLCVIPYEEEADAIAIANDSPFGLSGAVWSSSESRAMRVARQMQTGQVFINGAGFNPEAPFGGFKQSGNGRELGLDGLNEFVELKAIQIKTGG
jgi:aldehyde dehydrogenase (NAD+)